jgi:acyl-coenzyme A synthetase/AMP-(fatty) acid ligase
VGKPDAEAGNVLVAYVVVDDGLSFEQVQNDIRTYCSENMEAYETPIEYIQMTGLPRTMIGKVDYRKLEELNQSDDNGC